MKLSKTKTIRISEIQDETLKKMKSLNVDVGRFCREAIKEKIDRDYEYLKPKIAKNSFERSLEKAIKQIKNK